MSIPLVLGWYGDGYAQIDHPLFNGCKSYSDDEIEALVGTPDLVVAMRSCVRYNVARIVGKWPSTEPHVDDMLSVAMLAVAKLATTYQPGKQTFMKTATSRIVNAIEVYLNKNQAIAAPSLTTQKKRLANGEPPWYLTVEDIEAEVEEQDPDTYKRDVLDALSQIPCRDEVDTYLLSQESWGLTSAEIAKKYGVTRQAIHQRRSRLYQSYLQVTR